MTSRKRPDPASLTQAGSTNTLNNTGNGNTNTLGNGNTVIVTHVEVSSDLMKWRENMERQIDAKQDLQQADRTDLKENVNKVAEEINKGKTADAGRLERLLNVIGSMAPDILEVAIATLVNPLAGLGLVAKKIGDRAKVEQKPAT